jgi:hypothetical protein
MRDTDGCHWNATGHRLITSYMLEYKKNFQLNFLFSFVFSAQTVSLIWHVPYMDRNVYEHKERELHRICYQKINNENGNSVANILNGENSNGIGDFDLNVYLSEYIPIATEIPNEENPDRIGAMIGKMNETDRRILNLMDYYEKQ